MAVFLTACQTAPLPPINLNQPGWKIQEGQAVFRAKKDTPEIAGELLLATNPNGQTLVQFTKTPFPFVIAQTTPHSWQLEIPAQNKKYSRPGKPPARVGWFHLPDALQGVAPPKPWIFQRLENDNWRLENEKTGEMIEGFLTSAANYNGTEGRFATGLALVATDRMANEKKVECVKPVANRRSAN